MSQNFQKLDFFPRLPFARTFRGPPSNFHIFFVDPLNPDVGGGGSCNIFSYPLLNILYVPLANPDENLWGRGKLIFIFHRPSLMSQNFL